MPPSRIVEPARVEPFRPARRGEATGTLEAKLESARRQGYEEGLAAARAACAQQLDQERAKIADSLRGIAEFERRAAELLEAELLALAVEMAGRIVRERIETGDPVAERVARELLERFHVEVGARLRVNPADRERILAGDSRNMPRGVELVDDPSLAPGELLVEWRDEQIDARFEAVISELVSELRGDR